MDLVDGLYGLLAFSVIVLFLGTLNYFIGRSHSDNQISESEEIQQQAIRSHNQKKRARRQRRAAAAAAAAAAAIKADESLDNDDDDEQEIKLVSSEKNIEFEEDEDSAIQLTNDNDDEFEDPIVSEDVISSTKQEEDEEEEEHLMSIKQKTKNKTNRPNNKSTNHSNNENINSIKPQASVAPVKQSSPSIPSKSTQSTNKSQDKYPVVNENSQHYSYSDYKPLPPRLQQRSQKDFNSRQKSRTKKSQQTSFLSNSIPEQNEFVSLTLKQQLNKNHQSAEQNSYSSESDVLTESSSTTAPPLSTESQHSLSSGNPSVNEFLSIFDKNSFSSDELNFLLNRLTTKYLTKKQDWQITNKTDKTLERILDETYRSQAKILAIELQNEKNRLIELSKVNTDLENTLRQIQQPNPHLAQYQQTILHFQMEIRRITDENAHLVHQLHAYSMMPMTINEFKQQQTVFNEQIKQLTARNYTLEQEINDGERASKQAAEIYKKSDTQKQERIEQMMNDLNKYKKIDRELNNLRTKHSDVEKSLREKLNSLINERDQLKAKYQELESQSDKTDDEQNSTSDLTKLEEEFNELKSKNNRLKQRNAKILEELNKYSLEKNQNE